MAKKTRKYQSQFVVFVCAASIPFLAGMAEVQPDGGTATSMNAAQNGVPIVNVARPNAQGVSRNTYRDFDVNQQGLILNNSDNHGVSQLGGAIVANPNYRPGDGARIILNEVTSNQQSTLNGYIETFGQKAEFILANPNGISCNGCGFINTSRASLITGSEMERSGVVGTFKLGPGQVTIEGLGLNGSDVSYIDIISRAAFIQASLQAKERLAILTGNDEYDYRTRKVTSTATATPPVTYAIDANLLGSMYANQIELVTTEAGVGVRSAAEVIAQNDLHVDSIGSLLATSLQAGSNMQLTAADITNNGLIASYGSVAINASGNVTNTDGSLIFARDSLGLSLDGILLNEGEILSNGNLSAQGLSGARMNQLINRGGRITSVGNMSIRADELINTHDLSNDLPVVKTSHSYDSRTGKTNWVEVEDPDLKDHRALIQSDGDMVFDIGTVRNNYSDIFAGGNFTGTVDTLQNSSYAMRRTYTNSKIGYVKSTYWTVDCDWKGCWPVQRDRYDPVTIYFQATGNTGSAIGSSIQADGTLSLTVNGSLINGTGTPPAGPVGGDGTDTDPLQGITLPGEYSLFTLNESPSAEHNYLIETRFASTEDLFGSSYFLEQMGYQHTDDNTLFLGDAYYDQRMIADQVRGVAGQRFLFNDVSSDNEQYQRLVDQAARERERLGLAMGQELNHEQISSLEHDIVWYVHTNVDGYDVLAPRIYLSGATQEKIAAGQGARILGQEVEISANELSNSGNIHAEIALTLQTEHDLINRGGVIESDGDATLIAGGDLISESVAWSQQYSETERRAGIGQTARISAKGTLTLAANDDLTLRASQVSAGGDASLQAGGELKLDSIQLNNAHQFLDRGGLATEESTTHATSNINVGGNLQLASGSDMVLKGASLKADGNVALDAGSNLLVESVQDTYQKVTTWKKRGSGFSKGSTTTEKIETVTNKSSVIQAGGNLNTTSDAHTLILASQLKSGGDMSLHSERGDIMLISGKDVDYYSIASQSKGAVHTTNVGYGHYTETLAATSLKSGGELGMTTNGSGALGNITVAGAEISSQGDMRFGEQTLKYEDHVDGEGMTPETYILSEVDIKRVGKLSFETVALENKDWAYSSKTLNAGIAALAVVALPMIAPVIAETGLEIERTDSIETRTVWQQGAVINSGGSLEAYARGDIAFVGSEVNVAGDGVLDAEGDVKVLAAVDTTTRTETHRRSEVSKLESQSSDSRYGVGFTGEYEEKRSEETTTTLRGSQLNFGNDLTVKSGQDITVAASDISAGRDLSLEAARDLNILSDEEVKTLVESEIKGEASVSVGVGNAYNDFYQSMRNYDAAKDQRKQAEQALNVFDAELAQMQQDLAKGLVTEEDIRERQGDRKYYEVSLDLAKVNEANALVQIGNQRAKMGAAAASSGGTGFYADVMVQVEGTKTERRTDTTTAIGSSVQAGRDMQLDAGRDIHIEGSDVVAGGDMDLAAANDILIEAARNSERSSEERRSISYSYSIGTAGAGAGAGSWSVGANYGVDESSSTSWRNSQLSAGGNFSSKAGEDTTFAGANVDANTLDIETGDDLTILSRQNTSRQSGMDIGITANGGSQKQGESQTQLSGISGGQRSADRRWTDSMTTLTGREAVDLKAGDEANLKGAMVANITDDGSDGGNLSLTTGSLNVEQLNDRDTASNWSGGVSGGGSSSMQFQNGGHVKGQTVHATLGQGDITLTDEHETVPEELNRDIDQLTTVTANRQSGGANVDVTVDQRMLSKAGWESIAQDFADTGQFGADVYAALKTISQADNLTASNLGQALANNATVTLLKNEIARNPEQYGQIALDLAAKDDPVAFQRGLAAAGQLLQIKYGIEPGDINFFDTTDSASLQDRPGRNVLGATVVGVNSSENHNIFLDVGDSLTSKESLAYVMAHEVGENVYAQGEGYLFFEDDDGSREALNDQLGRRFLDRMEDLNGDIWTTTDLSSWQQGISSDNSIYTQYGNLRADNVGDAQVAYRQLHPQEIKWIQNSAPAFADREGISEVEAEQRLAQQAFRQVQFGVEGERDSQAALYLSRAGGVALLGDPDYPELGMGKAFYADPYAKANADMYGDVALIHSDFYAQNGLVQPGLALIEGDHQQDSVARDRQEMIFLTGTGVIAGATLAPVAPSIWYAAVANPATTTELGIVSAQTSAEVVSNATIVGLGTYQGTKQVFSQLDNASMRPQSVVNQAVIDDVFMGVGAVESTPTKLYHYTFNRYVDSIIENGLRPGASGKVFTTPDSIKSGLQAQIDLALPPNRGLPDAVLEIDTKTLQNMGVNVPPSSMVKRDFNMPGGGQEIIFESLIPPEAIKKIE